MTSTANRAAALATGVALQATRATLLLARDLIWNCSLDAVIRLPLAIGACTFACLLLVIVPASMVCSRGACPLANQSLLTVLAVLYAAAGVVWGLHATLRHGVQIALTTIEQRLPTVIDVMVGPLVALGDQRLPQIPVADVRQYLAAASGQLGDVPVGSRWRWLRRLATAAVRWCLRGELAAVERALVHLEQSDQSHVSVGSLKELVLAEALSRTSGLVRAQLFQFELAAAAVVLLLLVAPAVTVALLPL
jgi:hypothetical protein